MGVHAQVEDRIWDRQDPEANRAVRVQVLGDLPDLLLDLRLDLLDEGLAQNGILFRQQAL